MRRSYSAKKASRSCGVREARGARLFGEKLCQACHSLYGRGGDMGLALDDEGRRVKQQLPMEGVRTLN